MTSAEALEAIRRGDDMITTAHLAAVLNVAPRTVQNWVRQGRIPAPLGRTGDNARWAPAVIQAWLEERAA